MALALLAAGCHHSIAGPQPGATTSRPSPTATAQVLRVRRAPFVLPFAVQREVALAAGDAIYLLGGLNGSSVSTSTVLSVNTEKGTAHVAGHMAQAFHDAAGGVIAGRLFVFAGGTAQSSDTVQSFDPATGGSRVDGRTPRPLSDLSTAEVAGTVYLIAGFDGVSPQRTIYSTRDGATFRVAGMLPVGLRYAAATPWGGDVVVAGGVTSAGLSRRIFVFDPVAGTVREMGRLPYPLAHAAAFALGGSVYLVGGRDAAGNAVRDIVRIDPGSGSVARVGHVPAAISDCGEVVVGGRAWLLGGARAAAVDDVFVASLGPD
jgi:N-acetylneuraminic acid mutarotase